MKNEFTPTVGIDIGSHSVKVVVLGPQSRIMAVGVAESNGVVRGVITNKEAAAESVQAAVRQAERDAGIEITECYLAQSGESLLEHRVTTEVELDDAVDEETITFALAEAKRKIAPELVNRTVLHEIPQMYWVDTTRTHTAPLSLRGTRMGVSVLYISILEAHATAAVETLHMAGVDVVGSIAAPIASSLVTLTTLQKNAGCLHTLVGRDISIATIFEHGMPASMHVFTTGSNDVTEQIALSITSSLEEAERLKLHAGTELMKEKKKVLATILKKHRSFANDLRLFIDSKRRVLPAGVVLTGGGGQASLLEEHVRDFMRLPTSRASLPKAFGTSKKHTDASLTPAIGAALYGSLAEKESPRGLAFFGLVFKKIWRWLKAVVVSVLP